MVQLVTKVIDVIIVAASLIGIPFSDTCFIKGMLNETIP